MANKRIKLEKPIQGHDGMATHVEVREPTVAEFLEYGDPYVVGFSPVEKVPIVIENVEVLRRYFDVLVIKPDVLIVRNHATYRDAKRIVEAIKDFFQQGASETSGA